MMPAPELSAPRVIALMRVSTDAQDLARQRADVERLKKKFGLVVARTVELHGVSGTETFDHQEIRSVLNDLKLPGIDGIGISSLDRLFRPGYDYRQFGILQPFVDQQKLIWSVREGEIDPRSDEGYEKCVSAAGRAGSELREMRRRSVGGKLIKLERGIPVNGTACFGYTYINKHQANGQRFVINPEKAKAVRMCFNLCAGGMGPYKIAQRLNAMGILSQGYNGKPPGAWSRQTVRQMLINPAYTGTQMCSGFKIEREPIIGPDLFNAVQAVLADIAKNKRDSGRPSNQYLLRTFLWCGRPNCGHRCAGGTANSKPAYRCNNRTWRGTYKHHCDYRYISKDAIESLVWRAIWELLTSPRLLLKNAKAYYDSIVKPEDGTAKMARELAQLQKKRTALLGQNEDGHIDRAELNTKMKPVVARIRELEVELNAIRKVVTMPTLGHLETILEDFRGVDEPETFEERRDVLERLELLKITHLDGEVTITGKVPVPAAVESTGSGRKNCNSGINGYYNSFEPIPFVLKRRLA